LEVEVGKWRNDCRRFATERVEDLEAGVELGVDRAGLVHHVGGRGRVRSVFWRGEMKGERKEKARGRRRLPFLVPCTAALALNGKLTS